MSQVKIKAKKIPHLGIHTLIVCMKLVFISSGRSSNYITKKLQRCVEMQDTSVR